MLVSEAGCGVSDEECLMDISRNDSFTFEFESLSGSMLYPILCLVCISAALAGHADHALVFVARVHSSLAQQETKRPPSRQYMPHNTLRRLQRHH